MKKLAAILCIAGTTMSLSACGYSDRGDVDTAPPYATERTASHGSVVEGSMKKHHHKDAPAPAADRVFQEYQAK